jgi:hypothetical protein
MEKKDIKYTMRIDLDGGNKFFINDLSIDLSFNIFGKESGRIHIPIKYLEEAVSDYLVKLRK